MAVDWKKGEVALDVRAEQRPQPFYASAAVTDKLVIVGSRDKRVHALDRDKGEEVWSFPTGGRVDSSPVVVGERVYVGSLDGNLYVLDLAKGTEVQKIELGWAGRPASPAVGDGRLVIGTDKGTVYCLGSEEVSLAARFDVPANARNTALDWRRIMATAETTQEKTGLGNYFVANYPPFSFWKPTYLPDAQAALDAPPEPDTPLGLYLHIPVLPQALQVLLLPRLHRQERPRRRDLPRRPGQGSRAVQPAARRRRPAARVRLLRRRHAVVPQRRPAAQPDDAAARRSCPGTAPRK